jgi:hypothetical protein
VPAWAITVGFDANAQGARCSRCEGGFECTNFNARLVVVGVPPDLCASNVDIGIGCVAAVIERHLVGLAGHNVDRLAPQRFINTCVTW